VGDGGCSQGYKVYYTLTPSLPVNLWIVHEVSDNSLLTTVSNLLEDRTYSLRVLAFTRIGDGPLSHIVNVTTSAGASAVCQLLDPEGGSQNATLVLLVLVVSKM